MTQSAIARVGPAGTGLAKPTCPLCHTAALTVTGETLAAGAYWSCTRCGQTWDGERLATAASYAIWATAYEGARAIQHSAIHLSRIQ